MVRVSAMTQIFLSKIIIYVYLYFRNSYVCLFVRSFVPMPTHCTITRFGFRARRIDGVECGVFSNHAPLGQTTLRMDKYGSNDRINLLHDFKRLILSWTRTCPG